jgi:diguanylate cyclase
LSRLSRDSLVDPLTTVANRKGLDAALSEALGSVRETGADLAVAVVDVDRFKQFNDQYGHPVGDAILKLVARAVMVTLRSEDSVGRMGGDEFVAVLPGCSAERALALSEAVRRAVMGSDLTPILGGDILGCVTVSIGIASYRSDDTIVSLLDRADRYLLEAKASGRNRVMGEAAADEAKAS